MFIILCVVDRAEHLNDVLQAWKSVGITGITIIESTGLHRLSEQHRIPMRYALGSISSERGNLTLFTVVDHEDLIQACLEKTEAVVGDFAEANTGIFVAWPLAFAKGVSGKQPHPG